MSQAAFGQRSSWGSSPVDAIHNWIAGLGRWPRRGLLFVLGALTTLALPPTGIIPIVFLTLPALVWMLEGTLSRRQAFGVGWWFAFGYFTIGWYWISNALLVFSDAFWWMIPFALIALPAFVALFLGLATLAAYWLAGSDPKGRFGRALAVIGCLAAADMVRGVVLTGFPWNTFGYLWASSDWLSQGAAWIGVNGLGILVLASGVLVACAAGSKRWPLWLLVAIAIPVGAGGFGAWRLSDAPDIAVQQQDESLPGLRMVQSNIPQAEKWVTELRSRNLRYFLEDSNADRPDWVQAVLWPETAAAFLLDRSPDYVEAMTRAVPSDGLLITGAPRLTQNPRQLFNSVYVLDERGTTVDTFDKFHLVPFGEYVPFEEYMPFGKVTPGSLGYSFGPGPRRIDLPGLPPVGPLICYEVIFSGAVVDPENRPDWLFNATNDAWYGDSTGPRQHLHHARLRAVEEGLPLVRVASTGISAAFDSYGREITRIDLNTRGSADFRLPNPLQSTVFGRYGDTFAIIIAGIFIMGGRFLRYRSVS